MTSPLPFRCDPHWYRTPNRPPPNPNEYSLNVDAFILPFEQFVLT